MNMTHKEVARLLKQRGLHDKALDVLTVKPSKIPQPESPLEAALALELKTAGLKFDREVQLIASRKWRADFVLTGRRRALVVEVDGGTKQGQGRHSKGKGYDDDCEKLAAFQLAGFMVLKVTGTHIHNGAAMRWIREALL